MFARLEAGERIFLDLEDANVHMHVASVCLFESGPLSRVGGGVDFDRICDYVSARLYRVPRYRQRVEYTPLERNAIWVDDEGFNLQYHLRHARLPLPGDERQLKRLSGRIVSQQLDRGKPLWELWVVEGLEHDRFALISKAHRCLVDGPAGADLLQALLTPTPLKSFDPAPTWIPRPAPEPRGLVEEDLRRRLLAPIDLGSALLRAARRPRRTLETVRDGALGLGEVRAFAVSRASETLLNQPIGPHRRFDWLAFDLEEMQRIALTLGGTMREIALATVAGAVGRFLGRRGMTSREQAELDLRAACPVPADEPTRAKLAGALGDDVVRLPIAEPDARRRLRRISEATGRQGRARRGATLQLLGALGEWTPPALTTALSRRGAARRTSNLFVAYLPGSRRRHHLLGAPLLEIYPVPPLMPGQALAIALLEHAGGGFWGFNSDWELMPDLHDLIVAMDESFQELRRAADVRHSDPEEAAD